MPEMVNVSEKHRIDRGYLRSFGPVEEYIKVVQENRPNRWKHLARRAFLQRPPLKYGEIFRGYNGAEVDNIARQAVEELNAIVDEINGIREAVSSTGAEIPYDHLVELYHQVKTIIIHGAPIGEE